jgi:hypothetical protein
VFRNRSALASVLLHSRRDGTLIATMAWISVMANYGFARARLQHFAKSPPGRDIVAATEAIVFAAEDGSAEYLGFLNDLLDAFEWDPIKPSTLAKNPAYAPDMVVAGACIALMAGDKRAKRYLQELEQLEASRKPELKVVGKLARAVGSGAWTSSSDWDTFPTDFDELYDCLLKASWKSALNVAHTPHSFAFAKSIHYLIPMCLVGKLDATRAQALESVRMHLRPGPSRRGELLYRRVDEPPPRSKVLAGTASVGIAAIDLGEKLHIYHDGFSFHESRWKFDPDSPLASGLLELEDSQWRVVEKAVERSIWKKIEAARDRAVHVLAIDPALVTISDEARNRAGARFGINLEVVPFLQT